MSDYLYGRTVSTPSVSSNPGNGTVTYYYNTTDSTTGGTEWKDIGSTTLAANTYYMYAKIAETANYNAYTTGTTSFTVASATEVTTAVELKEALDRKDSYVLVTAEIAAEDDFTVDAATTLILEDKLSVYSMPMTVNGRVEIHEGGELYIGAEETLENNGIITNDGTLGVAPLGALYNAETINNNGTLNIEYDDGYGETGVFINGSSDSTKAGTVKNAGTITIDGKFINPGGGTVTNLSGGTITGEIRQQGSVTSGVTNANDSYYLAAFDANGGYWEDGDVLWLVVYAKKDASGYAEVSAPTSAPEAGASVEGKICVRWSYKDENGDDRTLNSGGSTAQIKQDTVFQAYWDFAI